MQEIRRRRVAGLGLRAHAPKFVRAVALLVIAAGIVYVGLSYYRLRDRKDFRMRSMPAQLSTEVVGRVENYERRVMRDNRPYIFLRASLDVAYADGHHEMENVYLEVYPATGDKPDKISAQKTITNGDDPPNRVIFIGAVQLETRDGLKAQAERIEYDLKEELGVTDKPITFERENVHGRSNEATLDAKSKQLELRGAVEITVEPNAQAETKGPPRGRPVTIKSERANFDQGALSLVFSGGATAEQGKELMSGETLTGRLNEQKRLQKVEARGNSYLRSLTEGRAAEIFGDEMDFLFNADQQLEHAVARRNVRARSLDSDSDMGLTTGGELNAAFTVQGERSLLREMRAGGRPVVTLSAPKSKAGQPGAANKRLTADDVKLNWRATGKDLERAEAVGNAELFVEPANPTPSAERKTLTAPRMDCEFYETGNLARQFTAQGGAKAVVEPVQPTERKGTRTLTSRQMVAVFFRDTQDVERFDANGEARFNERQRTLTSERMQATFGRGDAGLERVEAQGDAKFNELDRNGQSATMAYTTADETVRLRGGDPVVWDSRARLKANEIDSDNRNKISYGRGKATTTYYSQEQTNGAAPFAKTKSPVFIVSNQAEFQHETGVGIYTGAARAWQDDNFVRADRLTLRRELKRMEGEGNVQSALYNARRKEAGGERTVVPVFATAQRMFYADPDRLLHYEVGVDIKQGTERITGEVADVYLQKEASEVERMDVDRNVVMTQPGKRGAGDHARYVAADETVVLTGNPARVEDPQQGTSESRRLTVYLRENRVVSDGGDSPRSTGRVRSTHKVKKQ